MGEGGGIGNIKDDWKALKEQQDKKLNTQMEDTIGKKRFEGLSASFEELESGIKRLVLFAEEKEKGSGKKIEELFRNVSGNIFGHAVGTNGNPEKLIKVLEEFRNKTNFS